MHIIKTLIIIVTLSLVVDQAQAQFSSPSTSWAPIYISSSVTGQSDISETNSNSGYTYSRILSQNGTNAYSSLSTSLDYAFSPTQISLVASGDVYTSISSLSSSASNSFRYYDTNDASNLPAIYFELTQNTQISLNFNLSNVSTTGEFGSGGSNGTFIAYLTKIGTGLVAQKGVSGNTSSSGTDILDLEAGSYRLSAAFVSQSSTNGGSALTAHQSVTNASIVLTPTAVPEPADFAIAISFLCILTSVRL